MTNLETLLKESLKPSGLRNNNVQVAPAINTKNNKNTTYNKQTDDENIDKTLSRQESSEKSPSLNPSNHLFDFHEANFSSDMINNSMLLKPLNQETRHGFDEEYTKISKFENDFLFYFDDKRHQTNGNPVDEQTIKMDKDRLYQPITDWKIGKERIKTVAAALVLCLHLGVDPPDVVKTQPCARVESSIDYLDYQDSKKAIEAIGKSLQGRYELLSPRTKYKLSLDPCVEDLKRFCNSLRKSCKNERVLFHYNGHGVPKPTTSGEIWIFNRGYTQYIPVSLYDLQNWLGAPCIYVWDCNQAELIIKNFNSFVEKRKQDDIQGKHDPAAPSTIEQYSNCYQLAACRSDEFLPMNEELPADLFTCCLTTPIEISIKIYLMQSPLKDTKYSVLFKNNKESNIRDHHNRDKNNFSKMPDIIIPGKSTDRRTPLGELNWIFTAITDTIAWTTLPRDVFNQLFRHDLITAALFRNFLLAKKLMPIYNCHPVSHPSLPDSIINHPMWKSWDLAIDQVLSKLIDSMLNPTAAISQQMLLNPKQQQDDPLLKYKSGLNSLSTMSLSSSRGPQNMSVNSNQAKNNGEMVEAGAQQQYSDFFVQNLTAFELWLKYGSSKKTPPEQLPIVLQVLLSQLHRSKALVLLANFLDLGPWAVYLSLSIGIFPYVMKLLQGPSAEMKPILVFIWARIMAIDSKNTQTELIKEDGYMYFMQMVRSDFTTPTRQIINGSAASLHSNKKFSQYKMVSNNVLQDAGPVKSDSSGITDNQKAMATFVLTCFINGFELGQKYCFNLDFIAQLIYYAENSETALLRQWSILLLSFLYKNTPLYKYVILANKNEPNYGVLTSLSKTLKDPVPEVRTATLVAMTEFISDVNEQENAYKMYQDLQMQYNNIQQQLFGLQNNPMGSSMQNQSSMITNQHQLQQQLQIIQSNMQVLQNNDIKDTKQEEVRLIVAALSVLNDGSSVVRKELVVLLSKFVNTYMSFFIVIAFVDLTEELVQNESQKPQGVGANNKKSIGHNSIFNTVWKSMLILSEDPHEEIRALVDLVIGRILFELNDHPELGAMVLKLEKQVILKNSNVGRVTKFSSKNGNFEDGRLVKSESKNLLSSVFSSDNFSKNTTSLNDIIKKDNFSIDKKDDSDEDKNESIVGKFFGAIKTLVGNDDNEMNNFGINNNENSFSKRLAKLSLINQQYKVSPPAKAPRFDKRKLPTKLDTYLKSKFFDYSKEYFTCPQMRKEELDEPGSVNYLRKQWKTERNDRIIKTTQDEKELSLYGDWSNQIVSIENKTVPKRFKFTQFENYLVTSDERNTIRCFDWKDKEAPSSSFSNGNSYGTRISDLSFINEDDDSLLVTSTSDGVMKVYKDFHSTEDTTLVACWRGFTDMLLTPRSTGLISEWQQSKGTFLIGGDMKVIRCWDALTESVEVDIPAKTSSLVTTITSDQLAGNIFAAGFSDGTIRVYDKRVDPRESIMRLWKSGSSGAGNKSSINSLKMQRGGFRELVSGNNDGAVELWDIRYQEPVFGFSATGFDGKSSMTSAQVHEHAPVIATTSKNIELWTTSGDSIGMFKNVTPLNSVVGSLTSKNLSFVNSLIFHPHRMVLAANNLHETSINIYQCMENF